jgi:hypothetical protein
MSEINWKSKYEALKAKFMESVDAAFRLGYEQGAKEAQVDSIQQQQQQEADQMAAQANGMGDPSQEQGEDPNQDPNAGPEVEGPPPSANPQGSELDKHINELESMLQKNEDGKIDVAAALAAINSLKLTRKEIAFQAELKKSAEAIPEIAKALNKPKFKIGQNANHNLSTSAKNAVNMQEKIVTDIMKSWEEEEKKTKQDILSQIKNEVAVKKD